MVRHAESIANTQGRYQGQTYDTDLSPKGCLQSQRLGQCLSNERFDRIVSSPLIRTFKTASSVAEFHSLKVATDKRLLESDHGVWSGKTKTEVEKTWPQLFSLWKLKPSQVEFPDGELFLTTQKRVLGWWVEINELDGNTLVVTHDNIIRIILAWIQGKTLDNIWDYPLLPTAVTVIEQGGLVKLNDTTHLEKHLTDFSAHAL